MDKSTKANGKMERRVERVYKYFRMETNMQEVGKMARKMGKVYTTIVTMLYLLGNIKMENQMERDLNTSLMEIDFKENLQMV